MFYSNILKKILKEGQLISRQLPLISLFNYNLNLDNTSLEKILSCISAERKLKFQKEFELFLEGEINVSEYRKNDINYWNYIGEKFINSYPQYYSKFANLKKNFKENSKNQILFLGNNEYSNQQPCMSAVQFQSNNSQLSLTVLQRSCDANLGFLADIYHLFLFSKQFNLPLKNISILYGNIHIYTNNILETQRYIRDDGLNPPYRFIQNNLKR